MEEIISTFNFFFFNSIVLLYPHFYFHSLRCYFKTLLLCFSLFFVGAHGCRVCVGQLFCGMRVLNPQKSTQTAGNSLSAPGGGRLGFFLIQSSLLLYSPCRICLVAPWGYRHSGAAMHRATAGRFYCCSLFSLYTSDLPRWENVIVRFTLTKIDVFPYP